MSAPPSPQAEQRRRRGPVVAAVFVSFLLVSAVRTPVPAVNEPHYLCKAKHYWDPQWCARDFFLRSSDVHLVFYGTVGLLTRWLTLEQTAWAGRVLALGILAAGWTALVRRVVPGRWAPLRAAWIFVLLMAVADWSKGWKVSWGEEDVVRVRIIDFSGEWMVGGVEGKVFAYGFLFWGLGLALDRRWNLAAIAAGLAVSFHPVVGVWGLAAAAFATLVRLWRRRREPDAAPLPRLDPLRDVVVPAALLGLFSLPGIIPALQAVGDEDQWTAYAGTAIQVLHRLKHHLDPRAFPTWTYISFAALVTLWLVVRRFAARTEHEPWFAAFIDGTLAIAVPGLLIGFAAPPADAILSIATGEPSQRIYALGLTAMKFYPFRLAGIVVPIACAVALAGLGVRRDNGATRPVAALLSAGCFVAALLVPAFDKNPTRLEGEKLADWRAACRWIRENTPEDALFLTPRSAWGFKWDAHRAEYVSPKDCPQDAAGIVEWRRRLEEIDDWLDAHELTGFTADDLRELHAATGITHLLASDLGPLPPEMLVHEQGAYHIYRTTGGL